MNESDKYLDINRALRNAKTEYHVKSEFYGMSSFTAGMSSLKEIELSLLGDVSGMEIMHLQCHFGMDSLSLARMGARVTGVDISDVAIEKARQLNDALGLDANFICTDVYSVPQVVNKRFDMVFTTYGVIGWLPDMQQWADVVSSSLKSGGKLLLVEFHPMIWMFDNHFIHIEYSYFNIGPIIETLNGTYADRDAPLQLKEIGWNHPLSEVVQSLINSGMQIEVFREYDYSPYNAFHNSIMVEDGKYMIAGKEQKLPMTYALVAVKK